MQTIKHESHGPLSIITLIVLIMIGTILLVSLQERQEKEQPDNSVFSFTLPSADGRAYHYLLIRYSAPEKQEVIEAALDMRWWNDRQHHLVRAGDVTAEFMMAYALAASGRGDVCPDGQRLSRNSCLRCRGNLVVGVSTCDRDPMMGIYLVVSRR